MTHPTSDSGVEYVGVKGGEKHTLEKKSKNDQNPCKNAGKKPDG